MIRTLLSSVVLAACFLTPSIAQEAADTVAPEEAGGLSAFDSLSEAAQTALSAKQAGTPTSAENWMVAAANPLAVEAGAEVLRNGGSAADAMVAVQAVLGLVEPQSSGLGGGAFLVWYDANTGEVTTLDGRETAPLAVTPTLFQTDDGEPMGFWDAVVGGRSVGTPGTPMLMEEATRVGAVRLGAGCLKPQFRLQRTALPCRSGWPVRLPAGRSDFRRSPEPPTTSSLTVKRFWPGTHW